LAIHGSGYHERVHEFSSNLKATPKIPGARRVTQSKLHKKIPQILGATIQNKSWRLGFVEPPPQVLKTIRDDAPTDQKVTT
jgi:hypothetical protein